MKNKFIISIIILSFLCSLSLHAQVDTKGTDFWVTFGANGSGTGATSSQVSLQLRIVADVATTGTIQFTELGTSIPFSISSEEVYTYDLSAIEKAAVYSTTTEINSKSIHIQTDNPVTAYAMNQLSLFTDATNLLPTEAWGTNYYHIGYTKNASFLGTAFAVIAITDYTEIYYNNVLEVILDAGEVYYHYSGVDITGAHITSNHPVAYLSMAVTMVPSTTPGADYLFQQLVSVDKWGKNFFVPASKRGFERVRIVASEDGTVITQTGGTIVTGMLSLNAGEWVELGISFTNNGCYIQSNKPVEVGVFMMGANYSGLPYTPGDPSLGWVPPVEQKLKHALIAPFIPSGPTVINEHYALIITSTATKDNTMVKIGAGTEQPLSGGTWYDNTVGMSFYSMQLTSTISSYFFSNPAGLTVMGYGIGGSESYYYLASSSMRTLDVAFYINDIHNQDLASEIICSQPLQFRAEISGDVSTSTGHLRWYIDNVEETSARDQLTWNKILNPGTYEVKIVVLMDDEVTTKTVEGTLIVTSVATASDITANDVVLCTDQSVILTAAAAGVVNPIFYWYDSQTSTTILSMETSYTTPVLSATTTYYVSVSGDNRCENAPNNRKAVTVTRASNVTPSISILASANNICSGVSVIYTATPTNGGTLPSYQWKKNGLNISGATASTYTYAPSHGDVITCEMTSNANCVSTNPVTSNSLIMTVTPIVTSSVNISASADNVCSGASVTYTATPTNGGTSPSYQWKKNGLNISGATASTYTYAPSHGDVIMCEMTSNANCVSTNSVTSNSLTMTVIPTTVPSVIISALPN